jgi:hypothetical protein
MEFTQGKLNGLVKLLNKTYPFIVGVDYEKEDGDEDHPDNHTFDFKVDLESLSKIMHLDIDYDYLKHSPTGWVGPLWGLDLNNYEGRGEELYINGMDTSTFIANLIETIFFGPDDDRNRINIYYKVNK